MRRKGYILIDKLVNSLDYGVPQDRERIILFGVKYELLDSDRRVAAKKLKEKFTWGDNDKYKKQNRTKAGDEPGKDFRPFFCLK